METNTIMKKSILTIIAVAALCVAAQAQAPTTFGIGTGTENPNGSLKVKDLRVTLTDWSDFVFDDGYSLRPLGEVERYIEANRHLPDIPSAKEVEEEGVDVGEMNKLLLQKVEELTLYIIDLQKQIDELKSEK